MNRYLACLLAWVTRVFSCADRKTSHPGKPMLIIPAPQVVIDPLVVQRIADEVHRAVESFGSSWRPVPTAPRPTAGTTAGSTTTGIGGSPGPVSGVVGPFGMCIYPDKRKTRPIPGVDTEDPDA